ncbi:MAG: hypothetical protein HYY52_04270 [Candidatus Melainabacteria bacterium]|nr:hypothetical protein [Candidatus Melainabacteria bacterium]
MTLKNYIARILILFTASACIFISSSNLNVKSSQATIPLNIVVLGKLVITDAINDNSLSKDPTINVLLRLTPDLSNSVVSGSAAIRIRTNLNKWKLTAQRTNITNSLQIDPSDISITYTTQTGSKGNPNAASLNPPFDMATNLSQILTSFPTEVLIGNSKTSLDKEPDNKNNWFQLTSNYSILPDFFYDIGELNTTISYSLVSP